MTLLIYPTNEEYEILLDMARREKIEMKELVMKILREKMSEYVIIAHDEKVD